MKYTWFVEFEAKEYNNTIQNLKKIEKMLAFDDYFSIFKDTQQLPNQMQSEDSVTEKHSVRSLV